MRMPRLMRLFAWARCPDSVGLTSTLAAPGPAVSDYQAALRRGRQAVSRAHSSMRLRSSSRAAGSPNDPVALSELGWAALQSRVT